MQDNPEDELDPADDVCRRCRRIILPFYSAYARGQKKAVTVALRWQ